MNTVTAAVLDVPGAAGAWARFMAIANIDMPPAVIEAVFLSDRSPQTVADEHFQFARMLRATVTLASRLRRPARGGDPDRGRHRRAVGR
jgi:hypothetical protein